MLQIQVDSENCKTDNSPQKITVTSHGLQQDERSDYQALKSQLILAIHDAAAAWDKAEKASSKVALILKEIRDTKAYKKEFNTWDGFCRSLQLPGFNGCTERRANQLIASAQTKQSLISLLPADETTTDVVENIWDLNEATTRELQRSPESQRPEIARQVLQRQQETGFEPSAPQVAAIAQDLEPVATLSEIQELFAPFGSFNPFQPINKKQAAFRYEFARAGKSVYFKSLKEAMDWYLENLQPSTPSCLNCSHCDREKIPGELWCSSHNYDVSISKAEAMPEQCGSWTNGRVDLRLKPEPVKLAHPAGVLAAGAGTSNDAERNERWSPEELWRPALDAEGVDEFDLDPATCSGSPVPAAVRFTKDDDGLMQAWDADVLWANFPFSLNLEFSRKLVREYAEGNVRTAYIALKSDHSTQWWQLLAQAATAICLVNHRVHYLNADSASFFPTTVFYFGPDLEQFRAAYSQLGMVFAEVPGAIFQSAPAEDPKELWAQVGDILDYPKYDRFGGFMVENSVIDLHLEYQNTREALQAWYRKGQGLLDVLAERMVA